MYPKEVTTYFKFKEFISDVLKKPQDTFSVYFFDNDHERFKLDDDHDLQYFEEQFGNQKSREIFVEIEDDDFLEISFYHP